VAGRVGDDPEPLAACVQAGRAQLQRPRLADVEVADDDVEVRLLRGCRWPATSAGWPGSGTSAGTGREPSW
jgi:hypothetical protein